MVFRNIYRISDNIEAAQFFKNYADEQISILKKYMSDYPRKLQLVDSFGKEWDENEIRRLRAELESIMKIDVSDEEILKTENKSIKEIVKELSKIIKHELMQKKRNAEASLIEEFTRLESKLKTLEQILSLQEKWLKKNSTQQLQNSNKAGFINLIRREGSIIFEIDSKDIIALQFKTKILIQLYAENPENNTYEECELLLKKELENFDKDRTDFDIVENKKLGGGFVNPVVLIKTDGDMEYVAKGFAEKGSFSDVLKTKQMMENSGANIPKIVRVGDNEIIYEKARGKSLRAIFTDYPSNANIAFYEFGKALANMHKNTLDTLKFYDIRSIFRTGYSHDFVRLQKDMRFIKNLEIIDKKTYRSFVKCRHFYRPEYISTIHGDAHLDNFFYVGNPETIIVIDYDSARTGDPLADLGRAVASIRNWQFKAKLEEPYVEQVIERFLSGYKSILQIELRGVNLFALRLYLVIVKSSAPLIKKVAEILGSNEIISKNFGKTLNEFFKSGNIGQINSFFRDYKVFSEKEVQRLLEIQFCLIQINNFISGKDVTVDYNMLKIAA